MLGVWSSPDGLDAKHLQEVVVGKTRTWVNCLQNANLPIHLAWKAYRFQLGPAIHYGIYTLANRSEEIEISFTAWSSKCSPAWESTDMLRQSGGGLLKNLEELSSLTYP